MTYRRVVRSGLAAIGVLAIVGFAAPAFADVAETCAEEAESAADARDHGRFHDALASFQKCATDACPRIVRDDCRAGIAAIRNDAPTLIVRIRSARGVDVVGAHLSLDGASVSTQDAIAGVLVDVGEHVLRVSADGFRPQELPVVVGNTEHGRLVEVVLAAEAPPPVTFAAPPERNRTPALAVGVGGLAALGVFTVFGSLSLAGYTHLESTCPKCTQSEIDTARTEGIIADVSLGVGLAALVVATILWFTAPSKAPPTAAWVF